MLPSTGLPIRHNKRLALDIPMFSRLLLAVLLAAALVTWAFGITIPVKAGEITRSGCVTSLYWEVFFNQVPNNPAAESACLPVTELESQPVVSASLYWQIFLTTSPNGPQIAQFFMPPATGETYQP